LHELGGRGIPVVDSAVQTATEVDEFLSTRQLASTRERDGRLEILVTDMPRSFEVVASRFLGEEVGGVEQVDLGGAANP